MADDLEAFLRQAAQRRAQKAAGAQQPAAPARPAPAAPPRTPASPQPRRPAVRPVAQPAPARRDVVEAEVVPVESVPRFKTRVDTTDIAQHVKQLGEEVGLADEHMEAHLAQAFDHQVGSQVGSQGAAARPAAATFDSALDVDAVLDMLTKPSSVRNAIVLSEILRRPDFD